MADNPPTLRDSNADNDGMTNPEVQDLINRGVLVHVGSHHTAECMKRTSEEYDREGYVETGTVAERGCCEGIPIYREA